MSQKGKLSPEKKLAIVMQYLSGEASLREIAKASGIDCTTLTTWVRLHQNRGAAGLVPSAKKKKYSNQLKEQVVLEYLGGENSVEGLCKKYDVSDTAVVRRWIKHYNSHGAFHTPNKGGSEIYMVKAKATTFEERYNMVRECIANGKDYGKIVVEHGVSYQQIHSWVKKYETDGTTALEDRRGKRKPMTQMTDTEKQQLKIKQLEKELLYLQAENDLLKKVREIERGRR